MVSVKLELTGPENDKGEYTIDTKKPITSGKSITSDKSMTSRKNAERDFVSNVSLQAADFFKIPDEYRVRIILPNTGSVLLYPVQLHTAPAKRPVVNNISIDLSNFICGD
jgi:hypothetical protein